ncbi:hypothetical protein MMC12_007008 [Toensbergia leucococca]|nr:hypothetical protein [Toensbergia leucococca]
MPLNLTFGVELEFYINYFPEEVAHQMHKEAPLTTREIELRYEEGTGQDDDQALRHKMASLIRDAGIVVNPIDDYKPSYNNWTVTEDTSINPDLGVDDLWEPGMSSMGVEIVSKKFPFNENSLREVYTVLSIVNANFRTRTNTSTGLHIHVGNDNDGFSLPCVKRFCQAVTVFQHQIESIHPDQRIDNFYCKAPSSRAQLRLWEGIFEGVKRIEEAETLNHVVKLMNDAYDRNYAYNLQNLRKPEFHGLSKRTIEFRQHASSMDVDIVLPWLKFVVGLVRFCHVVPASLFSKFLCTHAESDEELDLLELLEVIGQGDLIADFKELLYKRKRPVIKEVEIDDSTSTEEESGEPLPSTDHNSATYQDLDVAPIVVGFW